jgi:thiol:disulfide interchange protein DsbD
MVTMKGTLAFLELAAAMKFLSNVDLVEGWGIFTRNAVLLSWIVLGALLTIYLARGRLSSRGSEATEGSTSRNS